MPPLDLKQRAVALLARREHSRLELAQKLAAHADAPEQVDAVLDELTARGLLSDARYADAYVRAHAARFGLARLRASLRQRGLAANTIEAALAGQCEGDNDELARARAVWSKKFSHAPLDAREWARQARFLQARGFAADVIRKVMETQS